ncbi:IS1182 family transposase, partial [Bacillus cytotoxicus]|nr:IS1182 family transposase [Bacillus cytotoxicus]
ETKRILKSPTDPDARLSVKHDARGRFAYFEHRMVDGLHNFIIDTHITPANVPGHRILRKRIECTKERLGYIPKEIALDAGYYNARLVEGLFQNNLFSYISYRRYASKEHPECKKNQFKQVHED